MLTQIDHVGYVVRDLKQGVAALREPYELQVAAEAELPQFSARVVYLAGGAAMLEVIEFTDPELAAQRLDGTDVRLDHVAYRVQDIEEAAARLRESGVRFCGPDGREIDGPIELGGAKHLLTVPGSAPGVTLQLIERS